MSDLLLLKEVAALLEDVKPCLKKFLALHRNKKLAPTYKPNLYNDLIRVQSILEAEIDRVKLELEECDD